MPEQPHPDEVQKWHRRFAVDANNRAWDLTERPTLTPEEQTDMLYAAYAAAHHWSKIGTEVEFARAEMLLGRAHARLGHGPLAMQYAARAFDFITARQSETWERALAHAVLANAAAAVGDPDLHLMHYTMAGELGRTLADQEKQQFHATFDRIPVPAEAGGTG